MKYLYSLLITSLLLNSSSTNDDRIVFPDEKSSRTLQDANEDHQIPIDFLQQLNQIEDINELLDKYVEGKEDIGFSIASRFGHSERGSATIPKLARCEPTLQTVELSNSNDSSLIYIPSCTRVKRCTGCCTHSLLSCQPTATEEIPFQVMVSKYDGQNKLRFVSKEVVVVEEHTKCACNCTIKEKDCNPFQEYRPAQCGCVCTNMDEKNKCNKGNRNKLWDPKICKCVCRETSECSTGYVFDEKKCACSKVPLRRRFSELGSNKERRFNEREKYHVVGEDGEVLTVLPMERHASNICN